MKELLLVFLYLVPISAIPPVSLETATKTKKDRTKEEWTKAIKKREEKEKKRRREEKREEKGSVEDKRKGKTPGSLYSRFIHPPRPQLREKPQKFLFTQPDQTSKYLLATDCRKWDFCPALWSIHELLNDEGAKLYNEEVQTMVDKVRADTKAAMGNGPGGQSFLTDTTFIDLPVWFMGELDENAKVASRSAVAWNPGLPNFQPVSSALIVFPKQWLF